MTPNLVTDLQHGALILAATAGAGGLYATINWLITRHKAR